MLWTVDEVMASRERGMDNFADLWRFLRKDNQRVELHTLNNARGPFSGQQKPGRRFVGTYAEALEAWEQSQRLYRPDGSYIRMNRYAPVVESRPGAVAGHWHGPLAGQGCGAQDIEQLDGIYQDFDPLPKVDCASEEQTRFCVHVGLTLIEEYSEVIPVESMGIGPSGNGTMVMIASEPLGNTLESARLIQMLANGAALRHSSDRCKLDKLTDAGRLIPACGVPKRRNGTGARGTSPLKPTGFLCAANVVRITREQLILLVDRFGTPLERVEHFSQIKPSASTGSWYCWARERPIDRVYYVIARSPEGKAFGLNPDPGKPCCPRCIANGGEGRAGRGVFLATYDSKWPSNKLRCRHDSCGDGNTRLNPLDLVTWVLCGHERLAWTDEPVVRAWFEKHFGRDPGMLPRSRPLYFTR